MKDDSGYNEQLSGGVRAGNDWSKVSDQSQGAADSTSFDVVAFVKSRPEVDHVAMASCAADFIM